MDDTRQMRKEQLAESLVQAQRKIAELEGQVAERKSDLHEGATLQESERRYRLLTENIPTVVWVSTKNGAISYISPNVENVCGYTPDEVVGAGAGFWFDRIHPEDKEGVRGAFRMLFSGGKRFDVEYRFQRKDGAWIWLHDRANMVMDTGEIPCAYGVFSDVTQTKLSDQALRESEYWLKQAQSMAKTGLWRLDPESGEITGSDELFRVFGLSRKEATLDALVDVAHPEDREHALSHIRRGIEHGESWDIEHRLICRDDTQKVIHTIGSPILDGEGQTTELVGTVQDITDRRRAEEALRVSEERLKLAIEAATDGYWDWNAGRGEAYFSARYYTMLGYEPNEFPASYENFIKNVHPEETDHLEQTARKREDGDRSSHSVEFRMRCKDGSWRWILSRGQAVEHDARGLPVRVVGTHTDITERKQLEEALRESEEKFRTLSESSPMGIFLTDKDGGVLYLNDRWCAFAGMAREDALGFGWVEALHPDDKPRVLADWQSCLEKKKGYAGEFRFVQSTGDTRLLYTQTAPIISSSGEVVGHVGANEDITGRRQLEAQLRQAEKMDAIGQLAGGIAHDFNNQLVGILGYAEMLREEAGSNPTLTRYADNILLAVKRSSDLTAQLLAFSRKGKYLTTTVDLHRVVFEVVSLLKHSIDKRISVQQQLKANPSTTVGDPTQLQSAVLNLALNARDVMPDGGELVFATDVVELDEEYCGTVPYDVTPGSYLQVSVADTGTGMDEQTRARIFEPFFTTKEPGKGTGMGLAAVYGTIKNHKGSITVYSEPGHGSTFRLYLPLVSESSVVPDAIRTPAERVEGGGHVLLVEDDEMVRDVGRQMLEALGYTVTTRADGAQALEHYEKEWRSIDLVILDMVMPVMGGKEAFIAMRKINPDIVALLSSGFSIDGEPQNIIDEGVKGFIQKPFRRGELAQKVMEVFGAK
jgi:PAS domain S-box-containing protein